MALRNLVVMIMVLLTTSLAHVAAAEGGPPHGLPSAHAVFHAFDPQITAPAQKEPCACTRAGLCSSQQLASLAGGDSVVPPLLKAHAPRPNLAGLRLASHIGLLDPPPPRG